VSFAAITLCVASQEVFIIVVYFVIDSVRKLLDTSYLHPELTLQFSYASAQRHSPGVMGTYRGRGGKPLRTRNIRIKCRQVVSFVLLSLHTWRKSPRYLFD
jgi:hypothetical protein